MARSSCSSRQLKSTSISNRRRKRSKSSVGTSLPNDKPAVTYAISRDDGYQVFHLSDGAEYTVFPAQSVPEHHWGTIYAAEWSHPASCIRCRCVVKATQFLLRRRNTGSSIAYRRPRTDFEREIKAFQLTRHKNVLQMYNFWEWDGRGYISMKQMKGSLGDVVYDPAHQNILDDLRYNESMLAELVRQVYSLIP
jgi:hypothetical protein